MAVGAVVNLATGTTPPTPAAGTVSQFVSESLGTPTRPSWIDSNAVVTSLPATVKLTGDLGATSSTSLTDTTGLVFAVKSGTYYRIEFHVVFQTANTGSGLKVGLTTPTFTILAARALVPIAADGTAADFGGQITSSGDSVVGTGVEATGTNYLAIVHCDILPSADGNVQVQHARGGASANNVTIKQGSHGTLQIIN